MTTIIKVDCPNCGDFKEAQAVIIEGNRVIGECANCGHTVTVWGVNRT